MIDSNYHTHTWRCGHATGKETQYIENALLKGMKVLGFSDHIIFDYKGPEDKAKFDDYVETINKLKVEYKDKIEIYLGFECEFAKDRVKYYKSLVQEKGIEYLILGQHFISLGHGVTGGMFNDLYNPKYVCKIYYKTIKKAFKTHLFCCLAHPDIFTRQAQEGSKIFLKYSYKICKLAKKFNIPLEINLNGHDKKIHGSKKPCYPTEVFWKVAGEVGNDVIVGVDAHSYELIKDADYAWAEEFVKKNNLHLITRLKF